MRGKRELKAHGHLWRSLFDLYYIPRPIFLRFIEPFILGGVFAAVLGVFLGWEGVALGLIFGLFLAAALGARDLLVRWFIRKHHQSK